MIAEFASEWLSWQVGDSSETPSQRSAKGAKSPSGTSGTSCTRCFQTFEGPAAWQDGLARLRAMERPPGYPAGPWQQLVANSEIFLREWVEEASRLGWDALSLYGTDKLAPYHRLDRAGLLLLVGDCRVSGLEKGSASLRTTTGAIQTYRRHDRVGSVLVWDLIGERTCLTGPAQDRY